MNGTGSHGFWANTGTCTVLPVGCHMSHVNMYRPYNVFVWLGGDGRAALPSDGRAAFPSDGRAALPSDGRAHVLPCPLMDVLPCCDP